MEAARQRLASCASLGVTLIHRVDGEDRMRVGSAGPHLGRHPNRFHEFLFGCALLHCEFGVATDAIGTLRYMRDRDRDELLGFRRQCAIGKYVLAKRPEGGVDFRRKLPSFLRQIPLKHRGTWAVPSQTLLSV